MNKDRIAYARARKALACGRTVTRSYGVIFTGLTIRLKDSAVAGATRGVNVGDSFSISKVGATGNSCSIDSTGRGRLN